MNKVLSVILSSLLVILSVTSPVCAWSDTTNDCESAIQIIYLDDGRYIEVSITKTEKTVPYSTSTNPAHTVAGQKTVTCKDADKNVEWEYILTAEFSVVEGELAYCFSASYTQNIYKSNWSFSDGSTSKMGNVAHGYGKFTRKALFVPVENQLIDLELTCDVYGHLS